MEQLRTLYNQPENMYKKKKKKWYWQLFEF